VIGCAASEVVFYLRGFHLTEGVMFIPGFISSYVASGFTTGSPDKTTGFLGSERGLVVVVL
jgi:hypothetical protein